MPWWRCWTCWLWSMYVAVVLYLSYTLVGPIAEPSPLTTGIVLLAGPVDRKALLFWRWRRLLVVSAILRLMIFLSNALIVCSIVTIIVPCDARVHKLTRTISKRAHSWCWCEIHWKQWIAAWRWYHGTVTTSSSAMVLSCAAIHPLVTSWKK